MKVDKMVGSVDEDNRPKMRFILRMASAYDIPDQKLEELWHASDTVGEMLLGLVEGLKIIGAWNKMAMTTHPESKEKVFFFGGEEVASLAEWTDAGFPTGKYRLVLYGFHDDETGLARKTKEITLSGQRIAATAAEEVAKHRSLVFDGRGGFRKPQFEQPLVHEFEET